MVHEVAMLVSTAMAEGWQARGRMGRHRPPADAKLHQGPHGRPLAQIVTAKHRSSDLALVHAKKAPNGERRQFARVTRPAI
jgi:hypothetical protein